MRARVSLLPLSLVLLFACKGERASSEQAGAKPTAEQPAAEPSEAVKPELGAHASGECREAMAALTKLDGLLASEAEFSSADVRGAWAGPLQGWVQRVNAHMAGRDDAGLVDESVTRLEDQTELEARRRTLVAIVTQVRTVAFLEARRLLTAASDADPSQDAGDPRRQHAGEWDDAWCIWDAALRPLARRADGSPRRGGEDWEATIAEAFAAGRAKLDDPVAPKASRQIIEKGNYAVAYRLILANAEDPQGTGAVEAVGLLELLDDRIADRNGPGLKRMRRMLNGDPAAIDPAAIERDLAIAFAKRARKYCDKAVAKAELGSPGAIAETWEGVIYTKVILPSMRDALTDQGFDADAYATDWQEYLEAVEQNDADTAATISARLVEWNCAYQDRLGIAECTSTANEPE